MEKQWTVETVKELLPDVPIIFRGELHRAAVRGRRLPFAAVHIDSLGVSMEFAWETIARALNSHVTLRG